MRKRDSKCEIGRGIIFHAIAALLLLWLIGTAQAPLAGITRGVTRIRQARPEQPKQSTKPKRSPKQPEVSEEALEEALGLLRSLGYWVDPGVEGLDVSLRHALIAFQKVEGRPRTGVLTETELAALRHGHHPQARESGS